MISHGIRANCLTLAVLGDPETEKSSVVQALVGPLAKVADTAPVGVSRLNLKSRRTFKREVILNHSPYTLKVVDTVCVHLAVTDVSLRPGWNLTKGSGLSIPLTL